jgi:hypothetical protein
MSTGWRRISTAKMLPLSVLVLAFIVIVIAIAIAIAIAHRRQLDANPARHEEHGRSTRVAPGW